VVYLKLDDHKRSNGISNDFPIGWIESFISVFDEMA